MKKTRDLATITVATAALLLGGLAFPSLAGGPNGNANGNGNGRNPHEPAPAARDQAPIDLVVRFTDATSTSPRQLETEYPIKFVRTLLASRRIHVFEATDPLAARNRGQMNTLAKEVRRSKSVRYAEADTETSLADSRYHSWPNGAPQDAGAESSPFRNQPLAGRLQLAEVHSISRGAGTVVAVLDTGVSAHTELAGRLTGGYDYVDDDADPSEYRGGLDGNGNGVADEAHGHGTFVAGLVALVAPDARIMPMRVLDSDGAGSVFLVAQAILEAIDGGADVVNISLGTSEKVKSKMLNDVLEHAAARNVLVVAAAGNAGTSDYQYPAQNEGVFSVTSTKIDEDKLSDFANWGDWVDVAAPAERVLGPVPGGRYAWWAGTSMAAPQVSAQVALILSLGERRPGRQVEAIIDNSRKMTGRHPKYGAVDMLRTLRKLSGKRD